jgi:ubiquinone biosynthesis protein COQ9
LLTLALDHVNTKGWNRSAIRAGAEDLNMSEEVGSIFTEYDLVKFFLQKNNDDLETYLKENKVSLKEALEFKVGRVIPYAPKLNEALAFATQPENLPESIRMLQNFGDIVAHYALQDTSTDLSWYAKRVGVASIYVATELHLLQDQSENYQDTWKFLERRVKDFGELQQGSLLPFANALPEVLSVGFTTALNILGRNKRR